MYINVVVWYGMVVPEHVHQVKDEVRQQIDEVAIMLFDLITYPYA
jgi:uncharacterized alkaline shock family protein YloU